MDGLDAYDTRGPGGEDGLEKEGVESISYQESLRLLSCFSAAPSPGLFADLTLSILFEEHRDEMSTSEYNSSYVVGLKTRRLEHLH